MRQNTEWGYIDWEYLPDPAEPKRWFSVGRTTILPGKVQPPHIHYGYEQLLYVLSGEADMKINGVDVHAKAGSYYILRADTTHETFNRGDVPYCELLVTNPIPEEYAMDKEVIDAAIEQALREAKEQGIHGKETTPFLLAKVVELTGGESLESNIQLVLNNARLAARTAAELAR